MSQTGRPNDGTDATGFYNIEFHVDIYPEKEWESKLTKLELIDKMQQDLSIYPGIDFLCYVRENPIIWKIPTHILYGEKDNLTAYGTIFEFVQRTNSTLSIMKNGEHWFHTDEQMKFLDEWIIKSSK